MLGYQSLKPTFQLFKKRRGEGKMAKRGQLLHFWCGVYIHMVMVWQLILPWYSWGWGEMERAQGHTRGADRVFQCMLGPGLSRNLQANWCCKGYSNRFNLGKKVSAKLEDTKQDLGGLFADDSHSYSWNDKFSFRPGHLALVMFPTTLACKHHLSPSLTCLHF